MSFQIFHRQRPPTLRSSAARKNFRGCCFKGQDLTNADFSHADIRGADFTGTTLTNANFSTAKAGLTRPWAIALLGLSFLLSAIAGVASGLTGILAIGTFHPEFISQYTTIPCVEVILTFTVCFIVTLRRGFVSGLVALTLTIAIVAPTLGSMAKALTGSGSAVLSIGSWVIASVSGSLAIALAEGIAGAIAIIATLLVALIVNITGAIPLAFSVAITISDSTTVAAAVTGVDAKLNPAAAIAVIEQGSSFILVKTLVGFVILTGLNGYISWRALARDEKHTLVRIAAVALAAIGGTRFRKANLTNANFTAATLKNTNFNHAIVTRTCFYHAKQLNWATIGNTILTDPVVQDLLVSGNGYGKSYVNANLRGANLNGADLSNANLTNVDLSQATLKDACLQGAILTQTQAIATNFSHAQLTGVCGLETWNIDSTTQLQGVDCRWVYLLEHPKPGTSDRERRPSSGEFAPGEFTRLRQTALDTVDLIFRNGLDWQSFAQSFHQVQVENEGLTLEIQGIEKKGDGLVLVKVAVPQDANKGSIHSQFMRFYQESLALATQQQQEIQSMRSVIDQIVMRPMTDKVVVLTFGSGDFEQGFAAITAQIWSDGHRLPTTFTGRLAANPELPKLYQRWQVTYETLRWCHQAQGRFSRIKPQHDGIKQVSIHDLPELQRNMHDLARKLETQLNRWLNSDLFSPIQNKLRTKLTPSDQIRLIIQSANDVAHPVDIQMQRLPWHLWNFFEDYRQAEVALSVSASDRLIKSRPPRAKVRILAILGNGKGIDSAADRRSLESLLDAEVVFLVEPTRKQLDESLWDEKGWDILCFSGHSSSQWDGTNGWIDINQTNRLRIDQLDNALKAAIERGLYLAIFNSCDGLGLANHLVNLHIPQIILMREPVPDLVAQEFLKHFLIAFSSDKALYTSVREAREKLQGMENQFPCASWLPTICQNPAEVPLKWGELVSTG
jgi:uncharacterized protein YjbI with pentapeptide repeats